MEGTYHQRMNYLVAKSTEKILNFALRWMLEAPPSDLLYTVALLQRAVNRIECMMELADAMGSIGKNIEQQKMWYQIRLVIRSIKERLAHHQQDECGTVLSDIVE